MNNNHPRSNIAEPHAHDVLSGRGAGITKHEGNKRWRELISNHREHYTSLPRNQRPVVAENIVKIVRSLTPPGRFLTKDPSTQLWHEIGDDKATEKTAQAMRDSKKNNKARSPSPTPPSTALPVPSAPIGLQAEVSIDLAPDDTPVQSCPDLAKPDFNRLKTDDTFLGRMEGFTFEPPQGRTSDIIESCPKLAKPDFNRLQTDDTFLGRMEGFTFEPPQGSRVSDIVESMLVESRHSLRRSIRQSFIHRNSIRQSIVKRNSNKKAPWPALQCTPHLAKPNIVDRNNTFDLRLEALDISAPRRSLNRSSIFSTVSFDMLEADELQVLEASCGMPSLQQPGMPFQQPPLHFVSDTHIVMAQEGDAMMEDHSESHWSI